MTRVELFFPGRVATWMDGVESRLLREDCRSLARRSVEKHSQERTVETEIYALPGFPVEIRGGRFPYISRLHGKLKSPESE
jgi:hypothetical protein